MNPRAMQCAACGARYDEASWVELPLAARVDACQVRGIVLGWPDDQFIQVRACRCSHLMAARCKAMEPPNKARPFGVRRTGSP